MTHKIDDRHHFDNPALEREWQAQESAMRRERLHLDPADDDSQTLSYRLVARALRATPPDGLPRDFAQRVSALATASGRVRTATATFETILTTTLTSVLLLAAVVTTILYGAIWWPAFEVFLPAPSTVQWVLASGGCLGLSWLAGAGSRLMANPQNLR